MKQLMAHICIVLFFCGCASKDTITKDYVDDQFRSIRDSIKALNEKNNTLKTMEDRVEAFLGEIDALNKKVSSLQKGISEIYDDLKTLGKSMKNLAWIESLDQAVKCLLKTERSSLGDLLAYYSNIDIESELATNNLLLEMYKNEAKVWLAKKKELDRLFKELLDYPGDAPTGSKK